MSLVYTSKCPVPFASLCFPDFPEDGSVGFQNTVQCRVGTDHGSESRPWPFILSKTHSHMRFLSTWNVFYTIVISSSLRYT